MNEEIRTMFDRISPVYDQLNDWLSLGQHKIWKEMTVKWSGAKLGDNCLDLCCGTGDLTFGLARHVGINGSLSAVDFSSNLLAVARQRAKRHYHLPGINWVEADVLDLPFPDNQFDAVTMGYGLRNVKDIRRSLEEIHRVLKPGAKAAILDFHQPSNQSLQFFQQWYLENIVVFLAANLGLEAEYAYIKSSLARFPNGLEQVALAQQVGFSHMTHYPITHGMMGVLVVGKT
jgi:demethylmenaquinone methyltransferase/2-methoxy-6-polyprenyl-1,4-benzoquinol methylase